MKRAKQGAPAAFLRAHVSYESRDCLIWPFGRNKDGYGMVRFEGRQAYASIHMCRLAHGEKPFPKAEAAHSCGERACVNPNHLRWATAKENAADRLLHGTDPRYGRNGCAKLTPAQVLEIRTSRESGPKTAAKYGVCNSTVYAIRKRKTWHYIGANVDDLARELEQFLNTDSRRAA